MARSRGQWSRIVKSVPEPDVFLDLGPGTLDSEAWGAKEVWPNVEVVGVEACEKRFKTLGANDYPGELIHRAVDEVTGEAEGYVGGRYGMFKFGLEKEVKVNNHVKVAVTTTTVDTIYQQYSGRTVFIWADIEGAELRMLKGATGLLESGNVVGLNLELFPQKAEKIWPVYTGNRCTADQVINFLANYDIECRGSRTRPKLTYGDFESKDWFSDFLFVNRSISNDEEAAID